MKGYNRRNMDDPVVLEALKTIESLKQIEEKHPNYVDEYFLIKTNHAKRVITVSNKSTLYGLFMPETELFWYLEEKHKSRVTKNEDKKDYAFYFDSENRLLMAEQFSNKKLIYVYLYYNNNNTEILVFNMRNYEVDYIRQIKYNEGKAIKYLDYSCAGLDYLQTSYFYDEKIVENKIAFYDNYANEISYDIHKEVNGDTACHEEKKEIVNFDIKREIKELIINSLNQVKDEDIYAFSLYVEDDGDETKPTVTFGYNTLKQYEESIASASDPTEAKWNYAFWLQNELFVYGKDESAQVVENWIEKKKLLDDDNDSEDDETPKVTKAFVKELIKVVKELHKEKVLTEKFGKELPIIIHELEYYEEIADQNIKANGKRLLGNFLEFCPCSVNDNEIDSNDYYELFVSALDSSNLPQELKEIELNSFKQMKSKSLQKFAYESLLCTIEVCNGKPLFEAIKKHIDQK